MLSFYGGADSVLLDSKTIIWEYLSLLVGLWRNQKYMSSIHFHSRLCVLCFAFVCLFVPVLNQGGELLSKLPLLFPVAISTGRKDKALLLDEVTLTTKTSQQIQRPLFFVKAWVMSRRAGLVMGPPVKTMHWGLKAKKTQELASAESM